MSKKCFRIIIVPSETSLTKELTISSRNFKGLSILSIFLCWGFGFLTFDYWHLKQESIKIEKIILENEDFRSEARILKNNIKGVKGSLQRVKDYTLKLSQLTQFKAQSLSQKTGVSSPLTVGQGEPEQNKKQKDPFDTLPRGIDPERLTFGSIFKEMTDISESSTDFTQEIEDVLNQLNKQKFFLAALPTVSPLSGWITSGFGERVSPFTNNKTMHYGLDIAAQVGSPVRSPGDGVVIFCGNKDNFGKTVMIAHGYGIVTRFGHNADILVTPGQRVKRGDSIATVGITGRTTGPHVHYEVWVNGKVVNPMRFILDASPQDGLLATNFYLP